MSGEPQQGIWAKALLCGLLVVGGVMALGAVVASRRAGQALAAEERAGSAPSASGLYQRALLHLREGRIGLAGRELDMALELAREPVLASAVLRARADLRVLAGDPRAALADYELALERSPGDPRSLIGRAQLRLDAGATLLAEADCAAVVAQEPDNALALRLLGEARLADGRARQAAGDLGRAIDLNGEDALAFALRARAHQRLKQRSAAAADAERAVSLDPELELGQRTLGAVLAERGDTDRALRVLDRALRLKPTVEGFTARAQARLAGKDWTGAIVDAEKALSLDANDLEAQKVRRLARQRQDEARASREDASTPRIGGGGPSAPAPRGGLESLERQGELALAQGDYGGAEALYSEALRLDPNRLASLLGRATACLRSQRAQGAMRDLDRYLQLAPGAGPGLRLRGELHYRLGDSAGAVRDLEAAAKVRPNDPDLFGLLGLSLHRLGSFPRAVQALTRAIELAPTSPMASGPYLVARAEARARTGDREGAKQDIGLAVARFPTDPGVLEVQARLCLVDGEFAEAIAVYEQILLIQGGNVSALSNKGYAESMLGQFQAAVESCSKAIALDPRSTGAYTNRARARLRGGDPVGAIADCQAALRMFAPEDRRRKVVEELLAEAKHVQGGGQ